MTPSNLTAAWLAYEAGAIASQDRARVATFLHRIKPSEVKPPLGLFQATISTEKADVLKLMRTLNGRMAQPLPDPRLEKAFETHWGALEAELKAVTPDSPKKEQPQPADILSEILEVVRRIERDGTAKLPTWTSLSPPSADLIRALSRYGDIEAKSARSQGLLNLPAEEIDRIAAETALREKILHNVRGRLTGTPSAASDKPESPTATPASTAGPEG